jgi:hypothetical protein
LVTVAVVDIYGDLVANKDLMHLFPPIKNPELKLGDTVEKEERK